MNKKLKEGLVATEQFKPTNHTQRLLYEDKILIDLVPFGAIAGSDRSVSWPPEHTTRMNVLGFEDAYRHSVAIRLRSNPAFDTLRVLRD